ncbi:hypothetical protein AF59_07925 [Streptococcus uberis C5072]|nr:hypothetical protein AF59_07925 [Streptococcus uberis C5072]
MKGAKALLHKTLAAFACQCFHLMISLTYAKIRISWSLPTIELFFINDRSNWRVMK